MKKLNKNRCGAGIVDTVKDLAFGALGRRLGLAAQGPREGATKRFESFLDNEGSQNIKSIDVARRPLNKGVTAALDVLSNGRFTKKADELGYDDVMHSYLLVTMNDGKVYKIEKNHVIEASAATKDDYTHEIYNIGVPAGLSLRNLIDRASSKDGKRFYQYSADGDNCQRFVQSVIEDNNLMPDDVNAREIIQPQRADLLVNQLESLSFVPKLVTDAAGSADRFVYGDGLNGKIDPSYPPLSNLEINKYYENDKHFLGCFSKDKLPKNIKSNQFLIINMADDKEKVGTHWTALMVKPKCCFYFDSFGMVPPQNVIEDLKKTNKPLYMNTLQLQDIDSDMCGYWCIYMLNMLEMGKKFNNIILDGFSTNTYLNDIKLQKYFK